MAIEVFNRFEYKYLVSQKQYQILKESLINKMNIDAYCINDSSYQINNLYIDTVDNHLISNSLTKPIYKEKLRIRSYDNFAADKLVYLEIKKKYKGLVNKRRSQLSLREAIEFIQTGNIPIQKDYMNYQVLKEIEYILKRDKYYVKTKISYSRIAYFDKGDHDLRISFDFKINSNNIDNYINDNYLMEIKTNKSIPLWLNKELNNLNIKSISFSKYGQDYLKTITKEK